MKAVSILALALAAAVATPAAAVIKKVTFSGTLTEGVDFCVFSVGRCNFVQVNLAGVPYVAQFTYDTTLGARVTTPGVEDYIFGKGYDPLTGAIFQAPVEAMITINGVSVSLSDRPSQGSAYMTTGYMQYTSQSYRNGSLIDFSSENNETLASLDNDFARVSSTTVYGIFAYYGSYIGVTIVAQGKVSVDTITTVSVETVPESATWAMLIAGFGLTGAVARRRRAVAA